MRMTAFLATACLCMAGSALAAPDLQVDPGIYQYGNGGLFTVTILDTITNGANTESLAPGIIETFCLEDNEYVWWGGQFYAQLNTVAVEGGVGGPHPDPLDPKTAWLYTQFLDDLFPVSLKVDSSADAGLLQDAIWHLEQEISDPTNPYLVYTNANCDWTTIRDIRALNLWDFADYTAPRQDVLARITLVPAPGAFVLGSLGVSLIGWMRRRKSLA